MKRLIQTRRGEMQKPTPSLSFVQGSPYSPNVALNYIWIIARAALITRHWPQTATYRNYRAEMKPDRKMLARRRGSEANVTLSTEKLQLRRCFPGLLSLAGCAAPAGHQTKVTHTPFGLLNLIIGDRRTNTSGTSSSTISRQVGKIVAWTTFYRPDPEMSSHKKT